MTSYIALMRKEAGSDYGVDFPDFPGCITAGANLEEARREAASALALHVTGMIEDGDELPVPSSLDEVMTDPKNRDAVAFLVEIEPARKSVRINISMQEDLLERIDKYAATHGLTRSGLIATATKQILEAERD